MSGPSPLIFAALLGCTADKGVHYYDSALPQDSSETGSQQTDSEDTGGSSDSSPPLVTDEEIGSSNDNYNLIAVMKIEAYGSIGDGEKTEGYLEVIREHDGTLTDLDDAPIAYEGPIGIEIHGASSSVDPKHNYRMELRNDDGTDRDYPLLDLGSDSDYVLHASYGDKTYIRNPFMYTLARTVGEETGEWQPGVAFAEVYLNGRYWGLYALTERQKRDEDRVNVPEPAATAAEGDITGGYLFKIDYNRGPYFVTAAGSLIEPGDPRSDEITSEQYAYVTGWWDDFEGALAADGWDDPTTGYPTWIDQESWLDFFLLNELAHNVDAYRLSTYLYKDTDDAGGLLHAGPIWDFDRALGNVNYCSCYETYGWVFDDLVACGAGYEYPFWWQKIWGDDAFQDALRCRWEELRAGELSRTRLIERMEELATPLADAVDRDQEVWGTIGVNVGYNYYVGETWDDELSWLRDWTIQRAEWMDSNLPGTCD